MKIGSIVVIVKKIMFLGVKIVEFGRYKSALRGEKSWVMSLSELSRTLRKERFHGHCCIPLCTCG